MSAESVFGSLQGYLQLRAFPVNVGGVRGRQIARIGEAFTMSFRVINAAHNEQITRVQIRYRNAHLIVQPTQFATFPDGSRSQRVLSFPNTELKGGESSFVRQDNGKRAYF